MKNPTKVYLLILFFAGCMLGATTLLYPPSPYVEEAEAYTIKGNNIFLTRNIVAPEKYSRLVEYIFTHQNIRNINVYLAGNGGSVASMLVLIEAMRSSPTKFHAIVYGNVYSAHAVLATNMETLEVTNENIVFLFHRPAVNILGKNLLLPDLCKYIRGTDRGIASRGKCTRFVKATEDSTTYRAMNNSFKWMTPKEKIEYNKGDDVVISFKHMKDTRGEQDEH